MHESLMFRPRLHSTILGKKVSRFLLFGVCGFVGGLLLGILLAVLLHLKAWVVLEMSAAAAAGFFGLRFFRKRVMGRENIVYYHHEISVICICTVMLFVQGLPVLPYLDIAVSGIGVFLSFGRWGCYSVGCCHGLPVRRGVRYGRGHVEAGFTWYYEGVPLLPVPLIESAGVSGIVLTGMILQLKGAPPGTMLLCYTVFYGVLRYGLEFLRGDDVRPLWMGVSEAQWTTLALMFITLAFGVAGRLPLYNWHLPIFCALLLTALSIVFYSKKAQGHFLMSRQISQLAEGLGILEETRINTGDARKLPTHVTPSALTLSCGCHQQEKVDIRHYTVSKKGEQLEMAYVRRVAGRIQLLKDHEGDFEIIDRQNGIYHILFTTVHEK